MRKTLLVVAVVALAACGGDDDDTLGADGGGLDAQPTPAGLFDPSVTEVAFEIDYASGAEPYTGGIGGAFGDTWQVFRTNTERLFAGSGKTVSLPTELADMEELADVPAGPYTVDELLGLADMHRDRPSAGATATFYILFLDDYYDDGTGAQTGVLGVSIGGTGVIAMFKPVIRSTGSALTPNLERFVEQSTLVHEVGHAVGLVDNGVPMAAPHRDDAHGKHCTNEACTMYWLNEGAGDAAEFARDYVISGDTVLFDEACLADIDAIIAASAGG